MARQAGADEALLKRYADKALDELAVRRAEKFGQPETDIEQFRKWLIMEAGYFDVVENPHGIRKEAKSISFAKMGQEEFNAFYMACRAVVWNLLCKSKFKDEAAFDAAVEEYMEM